MLAKLLEKKLHGSIQKHVPLIVGIVLVIGSVGLLLGAVTCAVSSLFFVFGGYSLVVSMVWGFSLTGLTTLLIGGLLISGHTRRGK